MLNHILATLNDYVLAFNLEENKYSFVSNNISELTGYGPDEFKNDRDLWRRLTDPRDIASIKDEVVDGGYCEITYRITTKHGETRWVNEKVSLFTDELNGSKISVTIIKDIQRADEAKYNQEEALTGYSILFDNNPSPMLIYEVSTFRILKVNTAAMEIYGYPRDEFLTMTMRDLRPETSPEAEEEFGLNGIFHGFNKLRRHYSKSGSVIYVEINSDSITYKNYYSRIVIAANVTEKVRWREEVKLREQFLNSLIDSQTNLLIRIDINGRFTFINKQFSEVFGYAKHEIIGQHFSMTTVPEELPLCEAAFVECIKHQNRITPLVHKKPDKWGKLHDTEWEFIAIKNEEGKVTELQGIGRDITDKVNAQKEIIITKHNLEALINNTEDLIWSVNREYRYLYMNDAYKAALSVHLGNIPAKGDTAMHEIFTPELLASWTNYYNRGIAGERYTITTENHDTDGVQYFETSFNPIYNDEGLITGVGCFSHNVTERAKTTKAITDKNERLQNIASLSSHELRRPVATMLGLIHIIDREDFDNPDNKQIIEHILSVGIEIDEVIRLIVDNTFIDQEII